MRIINAQKYYKRKMRAIYTTFSRKCCFATVVKFVNLIAIILVFFINLSTEACSNITTILQHCILQCNVAKILEDYIKKEIEGDQEIERREEAINANLKGMIGQIAIGKKGAGTLDEWCKRKKKEEEEGEGRRKFYKLMWNPSLRCKVQTAPPTPPPTPLQTDVKPPFAWKSICAQLNMWTKALCAKELWAKELCAKELCPIETAGKCNVSNRTMRKGLCPIERWGDGIPGYLKKGWGESRWQRIARFRLGNGTREERYWEEEEKKKCRMCGEATET
ncbi:hypothetical protein EAG_10829 [Camponotus floridanus]|uniref:Uncharacterized protein n=1 Tax=Camponotus floridanus TaxID=104421 RepID=E2A7X0_CAMFO|nr:hypothetical protein EAG_10829 [Camponotus floridanus]